MKNKRRTPSIALRLVILGFLITALAGALRVSGALQNWALLPTLGLPQPPVYFVISGGSWAALGLLTAAALQLGWRRAPTLARISAGLLAASYWADRLAFTRSSASWTNLAFSVAASVLCLTLVFGVLAARRQREYFAPPEGEA